MDYKMIEEKNRLIFKDMEDFDPKHIFECGQAFRWDLEEDGSYTVIAQGRVLNVKKEDKDLIFFNTTLEEFKRVWFDYFDLGRNYTAIKRELAKDPILKEAIEFGQGLRILNQEPFETIISFIISANNQIPRIKKSIDLIARSYGEKIDEVYYSFPGPEVLSKADPKELREVCRVGFRDVRIVEASKMILNKEVDLDRIYDLNREDSRKLLMELPGVGPKVADCILLFAYKKANAFPVDVWVKRVMEHFYLKKDTKAKEIGEYGDKKFGELAGFAQQYLFYYARELGLGK
ncbi:MAG: 8-oxoguanine DNA glycosylase [Tissierellia bacterium]|nr:8-oxoguanine DNA glycosylase [Tissierellia bacterium]